MNEETDIQKTKTKRRLAPVSLLGAVVEVNMIGWDGKWLVVEDDGGAKVWVQRPQDFKRRWVMRRYVKAPNDRTERYADSAGRPQAKESNGL